MFFASKAKAFCVEFGEQAVLLAKLSQDEAPLVVEELKDFPLGDKEALAGYLGSVQGKGPTGYAHAICGVYPEKRLIRRQQVDPKRVKDATYFNELLSSQLRIEPDKYTLRLLNTDDGDDFDAAKAAKTASKDVVISGLPSEEINNLQDKMLEFGIYPERLELGTIATVGALSSYLRFKQIKAPVLFLEIGAETTQSFIVGPDGLDVSRPIPSGIAAMIPVVQKELGLKDEESARKLFYSNTFDFTSMGATLTKKLLKELQSSIGFYEVQTGQSIGTVMTTQLPPALGWLSTTMASSLGVGLLKVDLRPWLESLGITLAEGVKIPAPDERWLSLFALMANHNYAVAQAATDQKK
jgi:Tfp pilus assembly PilM family ATPase